MYYNLMQLDAHTYQSLVFEWVVNTADQEPERPEILKSELQDKVGHQD